MFPIPWNKAFRKKDGTIVNIADAMGGGGGGSDLPPHSVEDAGKVLGVLEDGTLGWITVSGGGNRYSPANVRISAGLVETEAKEVTT